MLARDLVRGIAESGEWGKPIASALPSVVAPISARMKRSSATF